MRAFSCAIRSDSQNAYLKLEKLIIHSFIRSTKKLRTSNKTSSFSFAITIPSNTGNAFRFLNSKRV